MDNLANSGMPYDLTVFGGYKSNSFCWCGYENIQLICLIFVKVLIKIKRNSIDTLSKLLTCVLLYFGRSSSWWAFLFKIYISTSIFFKVLDMEMAQGNHATICNITISDWLEMYLVSNSIIVISKVNHALIIFPRS